MTDQHPPEWCGADWPPGKVYGDDEDVLERQPEADGPTRYFRVADYGNGSATELPAELVRGRELTPDEVLREFRLWEKLAKPFADAAYENGRAIGRHEIRVTLAGSIGPEAINAVLSADSQ